MAKPADAAICEDALEAFCLLCLKNYGVLTTDPVVWQGFFLESIVSCTDLFDLLIKF